MSANQLLLTIVTETSRANTLVAKLAEHAGSHEVVFVHEVNQIVNALDAHLRAASCAATALRSLAQGNLEPPTGP